MPDHNDELRRDVRRLPFSERIALLIGAIFDEHPKEPVMAISGLIELIGLMTRGLSVRGLGTVEAMRLSNRLRDFADVLERCRTRAEVG